MLADIHTHSFLKTKKKRFFFVSIVLKYPTDRFQFDYEIITNYKKMFNELYRVGMDGIYGPAKIECKIEKKFLNLNLLDKL